MSYDNTIDFKDHIVQYPNRFKQTTVAPGVVELVPTWINNPDEIIEPGTPVDSELFKMLKQNVTIYQQTLTATEGQTVINLARSYLVGQNRVSLSVGGVKQYSGQDYIETNPTKLTMNTPLKGGYKIEVIMFTASQALAEDFFEEAIAAIEATQAANEAADAANEAAETAYTVQLTPVANFAAIATTYPGAVNGSEVQTLDDGKIYRKESGSWYYRKALTPGPISELDARVKLKQGITCSELSMVPNSETDGLNNFSRMITAINQGYKILVENNYHLDTTVAATLNKPLEIEALNSSAKFTWKNGKTFLNASPTCTSIKFKNMQHVTFGASLTVLFNLSGTLYFEQFSMEKNAFEGNISLLRYLAPANIDPTITKHGFGTFRFEDNKIKNTRYSFGVMTNVPCDAYYIRRNQVDNFDYTVFNMAIENTHSFAQKAKEANKMLVAENNIVKNDDSWFGAGGSTVYYAFLVFEGLRAHYRFNHVEGIKCDQLIAVYDAYLSADDVDYTGNTWKNNICFNASKANNTLLKAKGGSGIKRYFNNEFIVEEAFATRLGKDPMLLKVNLYDITEFSTRWEINNNTFDVFYLTFQQSSNEGKEIWIENNTFKCAYVQNRLIYYRVMSGVDYTNCIHKVKNNTFDIKNALTGTTFFSMVASTDYSNGQNKYGKVVVDNNTVKVQDMSYLIYELITDTAEVKRNTIDILGATPSYQGIHGFCKIANLKVLQNNIRKLNGRYSEGNSDWFGDVIEDFTIQDKGATSAVSRSGLSSANASLSVKYRFIRQYEILCSSGLLQFSLSFDYWYDSSTGYNMITFTDDGNVTASYKLLKTTDPSGNGEGHSKNLKLIGTASLITARFTNTQSGNSIYLNNVPDGYKTIKIKTLSMIV